jgi:hypothetical protein
MNESEREFVRRCDCLVVEFLPRLEGEPIGVAITALASLLVSVCQTAGLKDEAHSWLQATIKALDNEKTPPPPPGWEPRERV